MQRLTGVDASLLQVLQSRGFQTSNDILETPLVALVERLDLSLETVVQLLKVAAFQSMPKPITVSSNTGAKPLEITPLLLEIINTH